MARANIGEGGRPFDALIVKDGEIVAIGVSELHATNDRYRPCRDGDDPRHQPKARLPRSHRLRRLCQRPSLPMCMVAMRLSGDSWVVYAYSNDDDAPFELSTAEVYEDLARPLVEQIHGD